MSSLIFTAVALWTASPASKRTRAVPLAGDDGLFYAPTEENVRSLRYPLLTVCSLFALQAVAVLYMVYPFDFGMAWNDIARLALLALILAVGIGTLVTAILAVLHLLRATARVVLKSSYTGRQ